MRKETTAVHLARDAQRGYDGVYWIVYEVNT